MRSWLVVPAFLAALAAIALFLEDAILLRQALGPACHAVTQTPKRGD